MGLDTLRSDYDDAFASVPAFRRSRHFDGDGVDPEAKSGGTRAC